MNVLQGPGKELPLGAHLTIRRSNDLQLVTKPPFLHHDTQFHFKVPFRSAAQVAAGVASGSSRSNAGGSYYLSYLDEVGLGSGCSVSVLKQLCQVIASKSTSLSFNCPEILLPCYPVSGHAHAIHQNELPVTLLVFHSFFSTGHAHRSRHCAWRDVCVHASPTPRTLRQECTRIEECHEETMSLLMLQMNIHYRTS